MKRRIISIIVAVAFIIGTLVTIRGLADIKWKIGQEQLYFVIVSILVVGLGSRLSGMRPIVVGTVLAVGGALVTGNFFDLLSVIWFALSAALLGRATLLAINLRSESWTSCLLVGTGIYGTAVALLAFFPVNYPGVYALAVAMPVILCWRTALKWLNAFCSMAVQTEKPPLQKFLLDVGIASFALIHFAVALMPEVGHDALAMHLFVPSHMMQRHQWGFDVDKYVWAVMPMLGEWLFTIVYMLSGETAARLLNTGFVFILAWLISDLVLWAGGSFIGAKWATLIFLTTPLVFTQTSSLFIDSIWSAFVLAGSIYFLKAIFSKDGKASDWAIAGLMIGAALSAKAVTFTILPSFLLLLIFQYRAFFRWNFIKALFLGLLCCVAIGAIPYATAWVITGNPVFPFFNQVFKSPLWPPVAFEAPSVFGKGVTWDILYQVTFHTNRFLESMAGASGFQWLLLFIPGICIGVLSFQKKALALYIMTIMSVVMTFNFTTYLRYVLPAFAWGTAAICSTFSSYIFLSSYLRIAYQIVGLAVIGLNLFFFKSGTYYGDIALTAVVGSSGRQAYLEKKLPIRNAVELVNHLNIQQTPVAVFAPPLTAGIKSDALYPNWYNHSFQKIITESKTTDELVRVLLENEVDYVIFDSSWEARERKELIEGTTDKIAEFGTVAVRKVKETQRFRKELVLNPEFSSYDGWILSSEANKQRLEGITASSSTPAYQTVSISQGQRYLLSATAECGESNGQGRLQVNWLDSKSKFIKTDIRVFECVQGSATHSMEVQAPRNASKAAVYASGHTEAPVFFKKISFRR